MVVMARWRKWWNCRVSSTLNPDSMTASASLITASARFWLDRHGRRTEYALTTTAASKPASLSWDGPGGLAVGGEAALPGPYTLTVG
jgi:hypothetical protein